MIRVNAWIELDEREIQEDFVRASGPGGQNVNKVSTAVQLRFDAARSPSLPTTTGKEKALPSSSSFADVLMCAF